MARHGEADDAAARRAAGRQRLPALARNNKLPDLVADLEGQIDIELAGAIDTVQGRRLRTSFESVPDAPVSKFELDLEGGKKGLLLNSKGLCGKPKRATVG